NNLRHGIDDFGIAFYSSRDVCVSPWDDDLPRKTMMSGWHSLLVAASPLCALGAGMIPSRWANRHALWMRRGAISLLIMTFCSALSASILLVWYGPLDIIWLEMSSPLPL